MDNDQITSRQAPATLADTTTPWHPTDRHAAIPVPVTCAGFANPDDLPARPDAGLAAPVVWDIDYPDWLADEILPGLFMGGTHDEATVADPMPLAGLGGRREFDAVVTLYSWAQPVGWEVEELRYGFGDGALHGADLARVLRAAAWAHERWQSGDRVLVRCQAGLNRSGLVTALVLVIAGWDPAEAIRHIRARRSPHALFNTHFVRWLLSSSVDAVSAQGRGAATPGRPPSGAAA